MKLKLMVLLAVMIIATSCGQHDKDPANSHTSVLESPRLADLTDSIKRFPGDAELRIRRALILSHMNQHETATADYKKAWEITGDESLALDLASNLMVSGHIKQAVDLLKDGMKKFPRNTEFNRRLAEVYLQEGNRKAAAVEYDKMIETDSANFEAWYDKGILLAKSNDTANAIKALEKSFAIMPINYSGMALANIYVAKKNPRILDICNIILSHDSANIQTEPVFMKGVYYADEKHYDSALQQFNECIRRDWKMTDAYIEKGIILYERKQYEDALKVFNMTVTVSNTVADGYYWLGRCYEATGKFKDAIENYKRAVALDKTFTEARAALQRLNS
ncbi:MAG TPA: tetratricopeptide repeat protein [Flavitalea sp.]|nr:tetratricopeptide repeat protein [Flavitalea sp.]